MVSVINNTIVNDLSYKADWRLSTILIKVWHVQVIHEVDKGLAWWWSEGSSSSLIHLGLNHDLKCLRVGEGIEVDRGIQHNFLIQCGEVVHDDGGLTSSGRSDVDHSLSS